MIDWRAHDKAHELEACPVPGCGGIMRLGWDTYTCDRCGHFEQDPSLHDIAERDGGHSKDCKCAFCIKNSG
jgi:hypothetical protein